MHVARMFLKESHYVFQRHSDIFPTREELQAIENILSNVERAFEVVFKSIEKQDVKVVLPMVFDIVEEQESAENSEEEVAKAKSAMTSENCFSALQGVTRVGLVAKGLLLKGERFLEMVLHCRGRPTVTLLKRVADWLAVQLAAITEEKYEIMQCIPEAAIFIKNAKEPPLILAIKMASSVDEDDNENMSGGEMQLTDVPMDALDMQKCLSAQRSFQRTKWFEARAPRLKSCVIVIRVLSHLGYLLPAFSPLTGWPLELLCIKSIITAKRRMGVGEALRRVLECLASGILLPDGPGLYDPCEREPTDSIGHLEIQEREEITWRAQHALRLLALGQVYKVLKMEKMPLNMHTTQRVNNLAVNSRTSQIPPATTIAFVNLKRAVEEKREDKGIPMDEGRGSAFGGDASLGDEGSSSDGHWLFKIFGL